LFQLVPSTLPTDATEFGLLLTPTTSERSEHPDDMRARAEAKGYKNGTKYNSLMSQILYGKMLPTPTTKNVTGGAVQVNEKGKRQNKGGTEFSAQLHDLAKSGMLPTPIAQEHDKITGKENQDSLTKRARTMTGKTSQLSPLFVEEMMGFPKNWTALPFQSGEENPSKHTETP
jgi:hypothetical protein